MNIRYYGGVKPVSVVGRKQFAHHDAVSTWDDGGVATELAADAVRQAEEALTTAIRGIQQSLDNDMNSYGAHQVRDAVVDYVANGYLDIAVVEGKLCVCFDASNNASQLRACFDLHALLRRATEQSVQAGDTETHEALSRLIASVPAPLRPQPLYADEAYDPNVRPTPPRQKGVARTERRAPV